MAGFVPKPQAGAERVVDLVDWVLSGKVRLPGSPRELEWDADDVVALLESVYLGYPVGSLLFNRRPAAAQTIEIGPLKVAAPELSSALWVVDGQQRLVALAASLKRPEPIPTTPEDEFVVYFNASARSFVSPPDSGDIPTTWVPVTKLLDASQLSEWVSNWEHGPDRALRQAVLEAGTRIREYAIPAYTVETDDEEVLRDIYRRVNKPGKHLEWHEVHDALCGSQSAHVRPSTLAELADALADLGMGRPHEQDQLLGCLLAFEGHDVTRNFEDLHRNDPKFLEGTAGAALSTLRRVLGFLRAEAGIVHLRLLPGSAPLPILTRFFRLHAEPSARSLQLLRRWLWRSILNAPFYDERAFQRQGVSDIHEDEEASVQLLLAFLPQQPPPAIELPARFDARAADSRLALLGLASLAPRDTSTGRALDVAAVIEDAQTRGFRRIVGDGTELADSPGDRTILPGSGLARTEMLSAAQLDRGSLFPNLGATVLTSHAITPAAAKALAAGDHASFLAERKHTIEAQIAVLSASMAEWSSNDRPSIDYLLSQVEPDHGAAV